MRISDIIKKLENQETYLSKLTSLITKMYNDGEINKDTFNKLDDFLKPYYDNSEVDQDY